MAGRVKWLGVGMTVCFILLFLQLNNVQVKNAHAYATSAYNPAVIQVEEVRNGGFLSGGTQEIAVVQRIDQQKGEVVVSATRQPNTPGVSGTGTVLGLVIRAVGPGVANLQILEANARNSQQQSIPIVSGEATIQVH